MGYRNAAPSALRIDVPAGKQGKIGKIALDPLKKIEMRSLVLL
jgi:hypothetical protein